MSEPLLSDGHLAALDQAISQCWGILHLHPAPHPDRPTDLSNLAEALHIRFDHLGQLADLQEVISLNREALHLLPQQDPHRSSIICHLATALRDQFHRSRHLPDLDEAIVLRRQALVLSHQSRQSALSHLGFALHTRFHQSGNLLDLDEAVMQHREALTLVPAPHSDRWDVLNNVAKSLNCRFKHTSQLSDLDEAVLLKRETLILRDPDHDSLNTLAEYLLTRFEHSGQRADVTEAISHFREALLLLPPGSLSRSSTLNSLATALFKLCRNDSGQLRDLDEAISFLHEALQLPPHSNRSLILANLAACLHSRFSHSEQCSDLDNAVSLTREALGLLPQAGQPFALSILSKSLISRFEYSGQLLDLDEAILLQREFLIRSYEPNARAESLVILADALFTRHNASTKDQCVDLDEAISLLREALSLLPPPRSHQLHVLHNLAGALCERFHRSGQVSFLNEAIELQRKVLELQPPSYPGTKRAATLGTLSRAMQELYNDTRQLPDIDEGISLQRQALSLIPSTHPGRSLYLNNLARALQKRYYHSRRLADLSEAISTCQESLHVLAPTHPHTCPLSGLLGELLGDRFLHTNQSSDLEDAMDAFRVAVRCEAQSVSQRFFYAQSWSRCADDNNHTSALEAYTTAIEFLPHLTMHRVDLQSRRQVLTSGTDGLARDAAACAIRSGQFDLAVELLEAGRAVFWSQALQLRTPLTNLRFVAPELAQKLQNISNAIEQGSLQSVSEKIPNTLDLAFTAEKEASNLRHLNNQWLAALEDARKLEGFENFLRAKPLASLKAAAVNGPIVILISSKSGCSALVLKSAEGGVSHIPLPKFTLDIARKVVNTMRQLTSGAYSRSCDNRYMSLARINGDTEEIFRRVLATLWASVVEPIFSSLDLRKSVLPPRLWWCPTGLFTSLPVHAAGIYNADGSEGVSDYVISSYIPTLSTLLVPPPPPLPADDSFKMLVVIQPIGQQPLPYTRDELYKIEEHVQKECLVRYGIAEAPAFIENVLPHFRTASIVHLACHGEQKKNPLESALLLEDGRLNVTRLMQLSLDRASLAFLSACQTAMGDEELPDEVIHLAAALLFVGFRGAVGTMWSIADSDGPKIADAFYNHLFSLSAFPTAAPDTTHAACALHLAVAKLRAEECSFMRWVPFIHLGA